MTACVHRWLLPTPAGPWIVGECRACGSLRAFRTALPDMPGRNETIVYGSARQRPHYWRGFGPASRGIDDDE